MTRTPKTVRRAARPGFTLVELMVAAAVCVLIMAILATCFQSGIDTLRQLRSQGEMTDQLRAAEIVIKRDLQGKRFTPEDNKPNQGVRLSDQRIDQLQFTMVGGNMVLTGWTPPAGGFMRIKSTAPTTEGFDSDGIESTRATGHYIHFTSILPGGTDQNVYTATVPPGGPTYTSPAAELAYFLDTSVPTGSTGGQPLFNLIRRQRLAAVNTTDRGNFPNTDAGVISLSPGGTVNTLADLTNPNNRLGGLAACNPVAVGNDQALAPVSGTGGTRLGDDVLLSNVISFEVKVNWDPATFGIAARGVAPSPPPTPLPPWIGPQAYPYPSLPSPYFPNNDNNNDNSPDANSDSPFDFLPYRPASPKPYPQNGFTPDNWTSGFNPLLGSQPGGTNVFDTWSSALANWNSAKTHPDAIPMRVRVKAVQIRIRIYDPKLKNSRQLTIVQDL